MNRGSFKARTPEALRELSVRGGKAAQAKGTAHQWTEQEARDAGHKGMEARRKKKEVDREESTTP